MLVFRDEEFGAGCSHLVLIVAAGSARIGPLSLISGCCYRKEYGVALTCEP